MFEGFEERMLPGEGAEIFCRIGGSGPALLLLHGFPQTGAMWAGIAPRLAERFTLVIADLRGYGRSTHPDSRNGEGYSKRRMAADMTAVMASLGYERFRLAGHDRGARVAYRLALDAPERVERLALLDIVPTIAMWERMDAQAAMRLYHWQFLAQPNPVPERLIAADPVFFLDHSIASWTRSKSLAPFASQALAEYRRAFAATETIHSTCEDYRAGWLIDRDDDRADLEAGRRIRCPTLVLWGEHGTARGGDVLGAWKPFCDDLEGQGISSGHFLPEEAPDETVEALEAFFSG